MTHEHRWLLGTGIVIVLAAALALTVTGGQASLAENGIIYVDFEAPGPTHDGSSWDFAYTDLQEALITAVAPAQIWVAAGTYKPTEGDDRTASFAMKSNVEIYGGFDPSAGATEWEHRNWDVHETILSGNIGDEGTDADNSYHVFYHAGGLDATAILDGFTITGGNANGAWPHYYGGGMYNWSSSPTLANCTFSGNSAKYDGGGIENYPSSSPTLTNCTFRDNSAGGYGGGIDNWESSPELTNCTFTGNSATYGGGLNNWESSPGLTNCTFTGNSATYGGGMLNDYSSSPTLTNCTFTGNSAGDGGAISNYGSSNPTLANCILWGDTSPEVFGTVTSEPVITYSDIDGGYTGVGNMNADPLFVDADSGDFHLGPGSPCIDTGDNYAPYLPDHDFEGDLRVVDGDRDGAAVVDMGVDEALIRAYLPLVLRGY